MVNQYEQGNVVRCKVVFTQSAAPIDPGAVLFVAKKPDGTYLRYTYGVDAQLVRDSVGTYHVDVSADQGNLWTYRFYSTGTAQASVTGTFNVITELLT